MASRVYNKGMAKLLDSTIDLASDVIRVLLVDSTYTFDPDHDFVDDVSGDEIAVSGYARATLASKTLTEDTANDRFKFDATDVAFGTLASGATVGGAVIYRQTGGDDSTPTNDELICFLDFSDTPTNGGSFTLQFHADGIFYTTSP